MRRLLQGMLLSLSLATVTSCAHEIKETFGNSGQWGGAVVPSEPNCGNQTTGLMTLSSREFSFAPFGGVIVIQGKVDKDHLEGSSTGAAPGQKSITAAPGQKSITIQFTGTISHPTDGPPTIQGTMTSSRCTWSVTLHRG
jgi:hypothetical protein